MFIIAKAILIVLMAVLLFLNYIGSSISDISNVLAAEDLNINSLSLDDKKVLKSDLEKELQIIREQVENLRKGLTEKNQESKTLASELSRLQNETKRLELEIREINIVIRQNSGSINDKELAIEDTASKIENKKIILSEEIRMINAQSSRNMVEILLSEKEFSGFLNGLEVLNQLQGSIKNSLVELKNLKLSLENELNELEEEKEELFNLQNLQLMQKRVLQNKKVERQELLDKTKGEEVIFQKLIKQAEINAEQIKNQIYVLDGGGQRTALTLEEAYRHALFASEKTGVRPAFLLALVQQESNWGANVGKGNWKEDMHPRHHQVFLEITSRLGMDPDTTPVSASTSYGWGGAMGPAQFLPSTWAAYSDKAAAILGREPNPWDIRDAFLTATIKLASGGATDHSYNAEWKAAMIYFAGSNWNKPVYRFYGDQVMQKAQLIQTQLDKMN